MYFSGLYKTGTGPVSPPTSKPLTSESITTMSLREGDRGSAKMERGEIDIEALQEAFLRNKEKPSAKVIRSKVRYYHSGTSWSIVTVSCR